MSRLDELIKEHCPNGVEYVPLWSVTIWDKKFNSVDRNKQPEVINYTYLLASDLFALEQDGGNVFLLSTGEQTGWTTEEMAGENIHEGEVVTIPWGKSRAVTDCIKYYKGKFVTADNRIMTSNNEMFHTAYDTSSDKFQNYYKDVSLRMKNKEIDLLIVVNMFLTGFDATTLNTLWVDKNLKYHGLIQAFSRTKSSFLIIRNDGMLQKSSETCRQGDRSFR